MHTNPMSHNVLLAFSDFGRVEKCPCDGYDVSLPHIKLHFGRDDFSALLTLLRQAKETETLSSYEEGKSRGHYSDLFTGQNG
jgi:hypothetical protein